jgi:hypothetical protein
MYLETIADGNFTNLFAINNDWVFKAQKNIGIAYI